MKTRGQIRIIGGRWKSRRVRCAGVAGLRPSPDAVRETLFNWLPHDLGLKVCLDLFAGSGALGFEAASRGASKAVMVESHPRAVDLLRANRAHLQAEDAVEIFAGPVERFLRQPPRNGGFDILFMDPPFRGGSGGAGGAGGSGRVDGVIGTTCKTLQERGFLNPDALVYIESPQADCPLPIPPSWHIIRENQCGIVHSTLIQT